MSSPYSSVSISGYNASPPSDDGSQVTSNQLEWSKHTDKIGDPLKTAIEAINTELVATFGNIYGQSQEEADASVTPADLHYKHGYYKRYGVTGDGVTDDTSALADMLAVGFQGQVLDFGSNITILSDPFTMNSTNENIPIAMIGYGVTLKANSGSSGVFITLENPQDTWRSFVWNGSWVIDANGVCTSALRTHGCQDAQLQGIFTINAVGGPNWLEEGESGYGIFYNTLIHCRAGDAQAEGGDDDGFSIKSTDGSNRIAANTRIGFKANWNEGAGFDLDRCSDTFLGPSFEKNDGNGIDVDNAASLTLLGGYSEHNHQSFSGDNTTDGTDDISLVSTANTNRLTVIGGNHIGDFDISSIGATPQMLTRETSGVSLTKDGMAFQGESLFDNTINFGDADGGIRFNGVNALAFDQSDDEFDWHKDQRQTSGVRGDDSAGFRRLPTSTTTNLEDISASINTSDAKEEGVVVFNTTTNKPVYATGNADGDVWVDATGSTAHTPV